MPDSVVSDLDAILPATITGKSIRSGSAKPLVRGFELSGLGSDMFRQPLTNSWFPVETGRNGLW